MAAVLEKLLRRMLALVVETEVPMVPLAAREKEIVTLVVVVIVVEVVAKEEPQESSEMQELIYTLVAAVEKVKALPISLTDMEGAADKEVLY